MIIVMAETTRATYELAKDSIAEGVPAPSIRVSSFDLVSFLPAFLLDTVWEASRVRVRVWVGIVVEESDWVVVEESGGW